MISTKAITYKLPKESLSLVEEPQIKLFEEDFGAITKKDFIGIKYNQRIYNVNSDSELIAESKINAIGLFSGAGGLDIGTQLAGVKVISSLDFDKDSVATMRANKYFSSSVHLHKDIKDITGNEYKTIMNKILFPFIILFSFYAKSQSEKFLLDTTSDKTPFTSVEIMPEYYGGEDAMFKFIAENIDYPSEAVKNRIEGRVYLKFTVKEDGTVTDVHVLSKEKLGFGCEEAAVAVIKKMPKWKPGMQNGKPVPVYFSLPIRFRLYK